MTEQITQLRVTEFRYRSSLDDLIQHTKALLLAGDYSACLEFLQNQPKSLVNSSPNLLVYQATAMLFSEYSQDSIEAILVNAEQRSTSKNLIGEIAAIRAIICSYTDDPERGIKLSQNALEKIDAGNTYFKNIIERNLGVAYTLKNDLCNADIWFEKLLMSSYQLEDWGGVLAAYNYLTYIRKVQGRLHEAEIIYQKALKFIRDFGLENMPHGIKIISGYGHLLLYWHRIEEAKAYFQNAIQLSSQTDILYAYTAYQHLCEAYIRDNDTQSAQLVLDELQCQMQDKEELYERIHLHYTKTLKTRISIEDGRLTDAYNWLISSGFVDLSPNELFKQYGYALGLTLPIAAHIYILKGMHDHAIRILKALIPRFIHQGANSYLIRSLSTLAIAYERKGQSQQAATALSKAIELGEPENNLGDFLFLGRSLQPVVYLTLQSGKHTVFLQILSSQLDKLQPHKKHFNKSFTRNTDLSQREVDVLQLIANGMTNKQIAMALFLSKNTIKSHNNNIYRKLKVENRNQAVIKARMLGILPEISSSCLYL